MVFLLFYNRYLNLADLLFILHLFRMNKDKALINSIRNGCYKSYKKVFYLYYDYLCGVSHAIVNDHQASQDIIQNVFIKIWESRNNLEINEPLKNYLFISAKNQSLNYLRSEKIKKGHLDELKNESDTYTPYCNVEYDELRGYISVCSSKLPDKCRKVFNLSRFEGLSHTEISQQMNISVNTIKVHIGKALLLIRKCLRSNDVMG